MVLGTYLASASPAVVETDTRIAGIDSKWRPQTRGDVTPRSRDQDRHLYEFADAIVTQPNNSLPHKTTYFQR